MKKVFAKTVGLILSAALCLTSFPVGSYAQEILTQDLQEEQIVVRGEELAADGVYDADFPEGSDTGDILQEGIDEEEVLSENTSVTDSISDNNTVLPDDLTDDDNIGNDGYFYPYEKDGPQITFVGRNNGEYKTMRFRNDHNVTGGLAIKAILEAVGNYSNVINGMIDEEGALFDDSKNEYITGWKVTVDGVGEEYLSNDLTYPDSGYDYMIQSGKDYYFTAIGQKGVCPDSYGFYIESIPSVIYNGRQHVIADIPLKNGDLSSKTNDLKVSVVYKMETLRPNVDYSIKYNNNKEASLKMDDNYNGIFEQKYTDPSKRPSVTVTGKGQYAGFSATAYFDIYPYNFGKEKSHAQISGLDNAYVLKDGKVQGKIAPKITLTHEGMKEITLKDGRDYEIAIYKGDKSGKGQWLFWQKGSTQNLVAPGKYLFAVRGKGNYCGVYCGQADAMNFQLSPAYPFICETYTESFAPWQFALTEETVYDLADMKINIGKPVINHSIDKKVYTPDDFQISVSYKKDKKWEEVPKDCYSVTFTSGEYPYIRSITSSNIPNIDYTNSAFSPYTSEGKVAMAGSYTVTVKAKTYNSLGLVGILTGKNKVRLKGITPKNSQLKQRTIKYDGSNDFGPVYVTAGLPYDLIVDAKNALNYHIDGGTDSLFPSSTMALYHRYVGEDIGAKVVYPYKPFNDRMPGTYTAEFIPVGSAIDHDKVLKCTYKRVGISLKEAEDKKNPDTNSPLFKVDMSEADNTLNVNGTMPNKLTIDFNGNKNVINKSQLLCNGAAVTLRDQYSNEIDVRIYAYNNKEPGQAYIVIEGDGMVFKGKSSKYYFSVNEMPVSSSILVINPDTYNYSAYGILYASMNPMQKNWKKSVYPENPNITLYQAYYKNEKDFKEHRLSYGKVDKKFYKLELVDLDTTHHNYFQVDVKNGTKQGFSFASSVKLNQSYTVYGDKANITSIDVEYEGNSYILPDTKPSLVFTGGQIRPTVKKVFVNGEPVTSNDYIVTYGNNFEAGKKKGSVTITLIRNSATKEFKKGGTKTFFFDITPAPGVTL